MGEGGQGGERGRQVIIKVLYTVSKGEAGWD